MAGCERTCGFCAQVNGGECVGEERIVEPAESPPVADKASFEEIGRSIGALVARKNVEYGDATVATAQMLAVLYPNGVPVEAYRDLLLVTRICDKLCRIARGNQGDENAYGDIVGYGILGSRNHNAR